MIQTNRTVAVDQNYYWQPMDTCPRGVKVQMLSAGGVALYSTYNGAAGFWRGWAPLPNKPEWMTPR